MQVLKVKDYLKNPNNTHIEDFQYLLDQIQNHITINTFMNEHDYEIDFDGYTVGETDYLNERLDKMRENNVNIQVVNMRKINLNEDYHNVNHILAPIEANNPDCSAEEVKMELELLIESVIKQSGKCILDLRRASTSLGGDSRVYYTQSSVFQITKPKTLMILAELKCKFNDKLDIVGIEFTSEAKFAYLLNYFTVPGFSDMEQLAEFMKQEYKPNDFIAIADLHYDVKTQMNLEEFNPRKQGGTVSLSDSFKSAQIDVNKIRLGVVISVEDDYLEYYIVTPRNIEYVSEYQVGEGKKSRYTYTVSDTSARLGYDTILSGKESIHGVEMMSEYQFLYELVEDLNVNPPRERKLHFSKLRRNIYTRTIESKVTKSRRHNTTTDAPTLETLRKRNKLKQTIYSIDDII